MKHIKTFENKKNICWIYTRVSNMTPQVEDMKVFSDIESAHNYYIFAINELAVDDQGSLEDIIFTYDDAVDYVNNNEYSVQITPLEIEKFELPEELKIGRDTKKYNI